MTEHEQLADNEARHGNREALERLTKELEAIRSERDALKAKLARFGPLP